MKEVTSHVQQLSHFLAYDIAPDFLTLQPAGLIEPETGSEQLDRLEDERQFDTIEIERTAMCGTECHEEEERQSSSCGGSSLGWHKSTKALGRSTY